MDTQDTDTTATGPIADANVTEATEFDLEKASTDLGKSLGFGASKDKDTAAESDETADQHVDDTAPDESDSAAAVKTAARSVPKSWAKEQHERWGKIDAQTQEYIELREKQMLDGLEQYKGSHEFGTRMKEVFTPYAAILKSQGVDEAKAAQFLLNAHYRLSTAQASEKQQYFLSLAKSYGVDLAGFQPPADAPQVDPAVKALQEKVNTLESSLTAREQTALTEAKAKVAKDVESFAADPKHIYFDECSEDIVALIQAGNTLEQAYEKAVYANPVTRAKELARLQADNEKTLREKSKTEAEKARKAAETNVRSRDTRKAPTEPKGSMEDTMRQTLKEIRSRTH